MPTISEKILSRACGMEARADDFVIANVDYTMTHDDTSVLAVKSFRETGVEKVWNQSAI